MKRRVMVVDHLPLPGNVYRVVRHRGLERAVAAMGHDEAREYLAGIGPVENIPIGKGRRAALRRARG